MIAAALRAILRPILRPVLRGAAGAPRSAVAANSSQFYANSGAIAANQR